MTEPSRDGAFEYDVVLSFAGQQRPFVERVAAALRNRGVRVFYDDYEKVSLWGKDLYEHLDYVYQRAGRFCVIFVSADYAAKVWTTHERKSAQARAIGEAREYILPFRFDETELPGLRSTVGYLTESDTGPEELAELINRKLGPRVMANYMPPEPVALFEALDVEEEAERDAVNQIAHQFFGCLTRMNETERVVLGTIFTQGCRTEMPKNIHMELDLIRRDLELSGAEIMENLEGMAALGVSVELRPDSSHKNDVVVLSWDDHTVYPEESLVEEYSLDRANEIAVTMLTTGYDHFCRQCTADRIRSLDFSGLGQLPDDTA